MRENCQSNTKEVKNLAKKKKVKKRRSLAGRIIKYVLLALLAVLCIIICTGLGVLKGAADSSPELTDMTGITTVAPTTILDDAGEEIIQLSSSGARWTEAEESDIPEYLKWAFIDLEDDRFYEHNGIDYKGILRAIVTNLTTGASEGASTITQQLIKNTVFETGGYERSTVLTVKRKIQEWKLALELEQEMSKEEILLGYMNNIYLGAGNYGVVEAASYYFGKDVDDLTLSECAVIAAITQNPSANNPARYPENNWERASACLANMLEQGHITQEEYDEAMADDVYSRITATSSNAGETIYSYYVDNVVRQVMSDLQEYAGYTYVQAYNAVYSGGLVIYSNQNQEAQEIIDTEINNPDNYEGIETTYSISWSLAVEHSDGTTEYYDKYDIVSYMEDVAGETDYYLDFATTEEADAVIEEFKEYILEDDDEVTSEELEYVLQPQASFTLMDYSTGKVIAICGGRGEKTASLSYDRATSASARRSPGSTFKIVAAFGPALDLGVITLATTFDDAPLTYSDSGKSISNWWGSSYRGISTVRQGIIDSMNIVACKAMYYMGASNALSYLRSFGYEGIVDDDANMATAIGGITNGVTNLENCAAYAAIANGGIYNEPMFYSKVTDSDGNVILDADVTQDVHRVIEESTASLLTDAMEEVVTKGTGTPCAISSAPLAGKTGTSNDYKDLWFVGYVPNNLCAAIWIGYDENLSLTANPNVQKAFYSTIMEQLVVALGAEGGEFEMTGDIVTATVCSKSGLLANEYCSDDPAGSTLYTEYFRSGTVPTTTCTTHVSVKICTESGLLAGEYCPEDEVEEQVFRVRPSDLDGTDAKGTTPDSAYEAPTETCDVHTEPETEEETTEEETTGETEETTTAEENEETTTAEADDDS